MKNLITLKGLAITLAYLIIIENLATLDVKLTEFTTLKDVVALKNFITLKDRNLLH